MNSETVLQQAATLLEPWSQPETWEDAAVSDFTLTPQTLKDAVQALKKANWGYLSAITGVDRPAAPAEEGQSETGEDRIEVIYHFCKGAAVANLRVVVPYSNPVVPSVCDLLPYASLYERELHEMLGVEIEDIPNNDHLLLPDEWPDGIYPLRKAYQFKPGSNGKEKGS